MSTPPLVFSKNQGILSSGNLKPKESEGTALQTVTHSESISELEVELVKVKSKNSKKGSYMATTSEELKINVKIRKTVSMVGLFMVLIGISAWITPLLA